MTAHEVDAGSRATAAPGLPWCWGATPDEVAAPYPCEGLVLGPHVSVWRAVAVDAPPETLFRWLCQLRVAPYSYDWLDNLGRRSPRALTPGVDALAVGQRFLVFEISAFEPGSHITGTGLRSLDRVFGPMAATYRVVPTGPLSSRLVVRLDVAARGPLERLRSVALAWGDVVMMRKELLTLKELAERQARRRQP